MSGHYSLTFLDLRNTNTIATKMAMQLEWPNNLLISTKERITGSGNEEPVQRSVTGRQHGTTLDVGRDY